MATVTAAQRDRLVTAAFGAAPGTDVAAAAAGSLDPRSRWLAAVVLGGQGHYAAAATVLRALLPHPDPLWASLAASALASHRRQLGAHAAARRLDALALRAAADCPSGAGGADPDAVHAAGARADALGLGELSAARRLVATVRLPEAADGAWRPAVRLGWVRAELALATGDARAAVAPARAAVELAERVHAVRHAAKSRLVLAAALLATDAATDATTDAATDVTTGVATDGVRQDPCALLHELAGTCARHRLVSLRWPAELLLAELHGGAGHDKQHAEHHRRAASAALRFVLRRADSALRTAAESSLWVPSEGLRAGDSAERSSVGEILSEICTRLCQGSTPRDR